jgi:PAS domain S-box-containing protein
LAKNPPCSELPEDIHSDGWELEERARLLLAGTRTGVAFSLAAGLILVAVVWDVIPKTRLAVWTAGLVAAHAVILVQMRLCCERRENKLPAAERIRRLSNAAIARGLVWATASVLIFPQGHPYKTALFVVVIAGLCSGAMSTISVALRGVVILSIAACLPVGVRLLLTGSVDARWVAIAVGFYPVVISMGARRVHNTLLQAIQLRHASARRERLLTERGEQLLESEEKYRLLFELSEDPMWLIDGERFVMANEAAARFLEYGSAEELANTHPGALSPPRQPGGEDSVELAEDRMAFANENGYHRFEWMHRTKSGSDVMVEVTLTRIPFCGRFALFCVWRDISERKWAEKALQVARSRAEDASTAKSEFLATMSHEIRTPLNAVLGMSELLNEAELPGENGRWAETVHKSGQALLVIINDILDFSKIEAGRFEVQAEATALSELMASVHEVFRVPAEVAGLELRVDVAAECPRHAMIDPGRMRQVLLNLVGNAIKFTDSGSVRVCLEGSELNPFRGKFRIAVHDTGPGISKEDQKRLFEPFQQADGSTSRKFGGTGLGLAISQRLVELMDGSMELESDIGEGSTFAIEFFSDLPDAESLSQKTESIASADDAELHGRVLVVEDVPANQMLAGAMLKKLGLEFETASNGREGFEAFRRGEFDAILMDCQMPEMDGFESTRLIRELETCDGSHVPIIALTANALTRDREICLEAGMDDFIAKPFQKSQLRQVLGRWLSLTVETIHR